MKKHIAKVVMGIMAATLLAGCCCPQAEEVEITGCCPKMATQDGMVHTYLGLPTADPEAYVIMLERMYPQQVNLGKSFSYDIMVTNVTPCQLVDVTIVETMAANFRYAEASPEPAKVGGGKATWNLGELGPNESKTITVTGTAADIDGIRNCATVSWIRESCMAVNVIDPKLNLVLDMPEEAGLCDTVPVTLTVTNSGTGDATNVVVTNDLPGQLMAVDGQEALTFSAGTIAGGASKEFSYMAKAKETGKIENSAVAVADGGLEAKASDSVTVRQAVLTLKKVVTQKQVIGRAIECEITAANIGDASAENVVLVDTLPAGAVDITASNGGVLSEDGATVTWNVPAMGPKTQTTVKLSYVIHDPGTVENNVAVTATCATAVNAKAVTEVTGIPAILLEVIDINDPVAVGGIENYVITATNQGSAPGTNIAIVCTLEESSDYVDSSGPTGASIEGRTVKLAPVAELKPREKATWKVQIKQNAAADVRFRVKMTSDQLRSPVEESESTHVY
jgi:uncharacterized repeat protein (TIGR01451 family)